jgi:GMP synthase (glutamine-hydrolysing)
MILILDFGSQTTHLIARRIRDLGVKTKIVPGDIDFDNNICRSAYGNVQGVILSGGPWSVYKKNAPLPDKKIFALGAPILGICYGLQATAHLLGGKVKKGKQAEYGPAKIKTLHSSPLFNKLPKIHRVWLSHGDQVVRLPKGFKRLASTLSVPNTAIGNIKRKLYGVQFHPEVEHTQFGTTILKNFLEKACGLKTAKRKIYTSSLIKRIKEEVGKKQVIAAVSGGVDSTVAAALTAKAIGNNLIPIYVENELMRTGTKENVLSIFNNNFNIKPVIVNAKNITLNKLAEITDPEKKRAIIGNLYIELFEKEAKKHKNAKFLLQGTIYSDVIESKGTKHAAKIKSHHNVGGLPEKLQLELLEPLRELYKDEVRLIGKKLGLPDEIVYKQPFPGPGQAIRIIGEVTKERLDKQHQADRIVLEEIKKAGLYRKIFQSFPVMTGISSTAVKGDSRFYGEVVALRVYESSDIMTAGWAHLPYNLLQKISSRIVNEVPEVSRVVYDITTKPPATMEWE